MGGINSYVILDPDKTILHVSVKIPATENPKKSEVEIINNILKIENIQEQYRNRAIYYSTLEFKRETIVGYDIYEGILEKLGKS